MSGGTRDGLPDGAFGIVADDDPRSRLAAAIRPIITMLVASSFEDGDLEEATAAVEEVRATLASRAGPKRARQHPDVARHAQEIFPTSPIIGMANPVAPPVAVRIVDGPEGGYREIHGEAWFDWQYEGPPSCVHGGVIAETFDEMLGAACIVAGHPGMTGTLTVRYRKPTPLRSPLRLEARCTSHEGRKVLAWAGLYRDDVLTAEAEGIFIEVRPQQILAIAEGNIDSADPAIVEAIRAEASRPGAASDVQWDVLGAGEPPPD